MKKIRIFRFAFTLLLFGSYSFAGLAQTITFNITVLPPYQLNIADYRSRPSQVLIIATNHSNTIQNIQLAGSITGDNGVSISTRPGYRSNEPLRFTGLQTLQLSANDIQELFDVDLLNFVGTSKDQIIKNGILPPGNYQICLQAFDYRTNTLLSSTSNSCSNNFPINSVEAPVILSPQMNQFMDASNASAQNIIFDWTMPPGASPTTKYNLKVVEMFNQQADPSDAIINSPGINSFEQTIMGNAFLYGPAQPPLTIGKKYAVQVTAIDPSGQTIFRNNGQSSVIAFYYGIADSSANVVNIANGNSQKDSLLTNGTFTSIIKGKVQWAFRMSEEEQKNSGSGSPLSFSNSNNQTNFPLTSSLQSLNLIGNSAKNTPLQGELSNPLSGRTIGQKANKDPSILSAISYNYALSKALPSLLPNSITTNGNSTVLSQYIDYIFANGSPISYSVANSQKIASTNTHPFANAHIILEAVTNDAEYNDRVQAIQDSANTEIAALNKSGNKFGNQGKIQSATTVISSERINNNSNTTSFSNPSQTLQDQILGIKIAEAKAISAARCDLLANTHSDNSGNFSMGYILPSYNGQINKYQSLRVTITADNPNSFAPITYSISSVDTELLKSSVPYDIGTQILLAQTYRLQPIINLQSNSTVDTSGVGYEVDIYRAINGLSSEQLSYLNFEGQNNASGKPQVVSMEGINYNLVAILKNGNVMPRMFHTGQFLVKIKSLNGDYDALTTSVVNNNIASGTNESMTLLAQPTFKLNLGNPILTGRVMANEGVSGSVPVAGAIVQIQFDPSSIMPGFSTNPEPGFAQTSSTMTIGLGNVSTNKNSGKKNTQNLAKTIDNSQVNLSSVSTNGQPFTVNSLGGSNGHSIVANLVNESPSFQQLANNLIQSSPYTTITDSAGNYTVGNLPPLINGARYNVVLIRMPMDYSNMPIMPSNTQSIASLNSGATGVVPDFVVSPQVVTVTGIVLDESGKRVPSAHFQIQGTSIIGDADQNGYFSLQCAKGPQTLLISKMGYATLSTSIIAGAPPTPSPTSVGNTKIKSTVSSANIAKSSVATTENAVEMTPDAYYQLKLLQGEVQFEVIADGNPVQNAHVSLSIIETNVDTSHSTDASGKWLYEGRGGNALVTVSGPQGSVWVTTQQSVSIEPTGNLDTVVFNLQSGVLISGTVKANGKPVANATVTDQNTSYLVAQADASGNYSIVVPQNEGAILKGSAQGYIAGSKNLGIATVNKTRVEIDLQTGGGKNISTLLGFPIQLDSVSTNGNSQIWNGSFVHLQPAVPELKSVGNVVLHFSNLRVSFDVLGNAIPDGDSVLTDATQIPMTVFNYLPIKLTDSSNGSLVVRKFGNDSTGKIAGVISLNIDLSNVVPGLSKLGTNPNDFLPPISLPDSNSFAPFFSHANLTALPAILGFANDSSEKMSMYGFEIDINLLKSTISSNGIMLKGTLKTPNLGIIDSTTMTIDKFAIDTKFNPSISLANLNPPPSFTVGSWSATLFNLAIDENGLTLGGSITITVPKSKNATLNFIGLKLGTSSVYGGSFTLPNQGVDLFGAVTVKGASVPFSFGEMGNSGIYRLAGSGSLHFPNYVQQDINIPLFQIETDGQLDVSAAVNVNADLGFVKLSVDSLEINTISTTPFVGIKGQFTVDIPVLQFSAGEMKFSANGKVSVGDINASANFDVASLSAAIAIHYNSNGLADGFSGSGSINVVNAFDVNAQFHYFKDKGNLDFGCSFSTGVVIPIGDVTITQVGGGFDYSTTNGLILTVSGTASVTGTGPAVNFTNIFVTIDVNKGTIDGGCTVTVATVFDALKASLHIDIPNLQFSLGVTGKLSPMPSMAQANLNAELMLSAKKGDMYLFLGTVMDINVLDGVINSQGDYILAINLKNPGHRGDATDIYFKQACIPSSYFANNFTGVYADASFSFKASGNLDFGIGDVSAYASTATRSAFLLNFSNNSYFMLLAGSYSGGLHATLGYDGFGFSAGGGFSACYTLQGGRNDVLGWNINGNAVGSANLEAGIGCSCGSGCNSFCVGTDFDIPCGVSAKVCGTATLNMSISQTNGANIGFSLGGNITNCNIQF